MADQKILSSDHQYKTLEECFLQDHITKLFVVAEKVLEKMDISMYFDSLEGRLGIQVIRFSAFTPNPRYEEVEHGVALFRKEKCDGIIAVGGGSAMDVAKCIKLYSNMNPEENYLKQTIVPNTIPFYVVPTTAGTGSEATKFAVIYYNNEKQSISHESCIPSVVLFQEHLLETLPLYQKKSTLLDALCHGIESFWSVNSTEESKQFSKAAITEILSNYDAYLNNQAEARKNMFLAAYQAGKAINITQTTAGHAMCYKITSLYGISHGHAAALCVQKLWFYMLEHLDQCTDSRGVTYLETMFSDLAHLFGADTAQEGAMRFEQFVDSLDMEHPVASSEEEYNLLIHSVNPVRLKNNPIFLVEKDIENLYHQILGKDMNRES